MAERQPTETTNLDIYGNAALEWSRAHEAMSVPPNENLTWFFGTVDPDGRPHAAGVGALYIDGDIYVVSGPKTRKSRNLAANPACSISVGLKGIDMVFEGEAQRVTDDETLRRVVAVFQKGGWPAEVEGDAFTGPYSAPSAGPPPWYLYRFTFDTAVGVAGEEPHGATRWTFASIAMHHFEPLIGEWRVHGEIPIESPMTITGEAAFERLGDFVVYKTVGEPAEVPDSISIIGGAAENEPQPMHYFDSRGVKRMYVTSVDGSTWSIWRAPSEDWNGPDGPGFNQRFIGEISADGNAIEGRWERGMGDAGDQWELDFPISDRRK